jgi:hypothetical protein
MLPQTLDEAVEALYTLAESLPGALEYIKNTQNWAIQQHHQLGRTYRNLWSLWDRTTPLVNFMNTTYGISHADDISGLILRSLEHKVKGTTFDIEAKVNEYKAHWAVYGGD